LFIYQRDGSSISLVDHFDADIGKNDGNKSRRNDHKTPEGIYFLLTKKTPPEIPFSLYGEKAFTTNYPNFFDKLENKTGDGIWLHAVPDTIPLTRGSRGCVVLNNESIRKVDKYIKLKETPLIIFDQVDYVSPEEHTKRTQHFRDWLEKWRKSWEDQNIDSYLSFYDSRFQAPGGFDYDRWMNHKKKLKKNYEFIRVTLSQPFLLLHRNQLIIKTLQKYTSNKHTDYGVKVLHVVVQGDSDYKIVREEWERASESGEIMSMSQNIKSPRPDSTN
jgi:murein L,D-transpeptidase YafK